jgi:hypothetical protein
MEGYPGPLPKHLSNLLYYGALVGYKGPQTLILSSNLPSALQDPHTIDRQLEQDLAIGRVVWTTPCYPFISSPLGLVAKKDGGFRRIHHLSHPLQGSVNSQINEDSSTLVYTRIQVILDNIIIAGKGAIIIKRDIKEAFRNIPLAPQNQWLLGFSWKGQFYKETCLSFGLSTAPFIFNLFAEGFHWILQSRLRWKLLEHYLDDFILIIPPHDLDATDTRTHEYIQLTDLLGVPRNDSKDCQGTIATIFGLEVDTAKSHLRLPQEKLDKAKDLTSKALQAQSISARQAYELAGFLTFCAPAVQLGRVFMRRLWSFVASFPYQGSQFQKRRIPALVYQDIQWWNTLVEAHNGTLFFDNENREHIYLFTDASVTGIGGYYTKVSNAQYSDIERKNTFAEATLAQLQGQFDINISEVQAILHALIQWGHQWHSTRLHVFTDSYTANTGLQHQTLRSSANIYIRKILLTAAKHDIVIHSNWIPGHTNKLADALSRFDTRGLANLCPHW